MHTTADKSESITQNQEQRSSHPRLKSHSDFGFILTEDEQSMGLHFHGSHYLHILLLLFVLFSACGVEYATAKYHTSAQRQFSVPAVPKPPDAEA